MKLAALAVLTTLGLGGVAAAQPAPPAPRNPHAAERAAERNEMRQMILARFDANHDGQLDPRERRHAARALRRMARELAGDRHQRPAAAPPQDDAQ